LRGDGAPEPGPAYVTLADAIECGALRVRERRDGASVPLIHVANHGDVAVLVLFGEELRGALQNRVANASFLVPARGSLEIDVSCVEQGRWGARGRAADFVSAKAVLASSIRRKMAAKVARSRERGLGFDADQSEVWREVMCRIGFSGAESDTLAYGDYAGSREPDVEEAARAFHPLPGQVGFVAAIGDEVVGLEAIGREAVFARAFDGLLRAYLVDAVDATQLRRLDHTLGRGAPAARFDAPEPFLAALSRAPATEGPSLGLGRDVRVRGGGVAACALLADTALVHLTAFVEEGL
jgi:hypothetical protein